MYIHIYISLYIYVYRYRHNTSPELLGQMHFTSCVWHIFSGPMLLGLPLQSQAACHCFYCQCWLTLQSSGLNHISPSSPHLLCIIMWGSKHTHLSGVTQTPDKVPFLVASFRENHLLLLPTWAWSLVCMLLSWSFILNLSYKNILGLFLAKLQEGGCLVRLWLDWTITKRNLKQ